MSKNREHKTLLQYYKSKWYWFVCSLLITLGLSVVYLIRTPKLYLRKATVMIQNENFILNAESHAAKPDKLLNTIVNNEIAILKSNRLMTKTVRQLNLAMSYRTKDGIRKTELYNRSPVLLYFPDVKEYQSYTVKAKLLSNQKVQLWDFEMNGVKDEKMIIIQLNKTIDTPFGKLIVTPTHWFEERWYGQTITIHKSTIEKTVDYFLKAVQVSSADDPSSVINVSIRDVSILRANDILNTLITNYIEESTNYKKQIATYREMFINERLSLIEQGIVIENYIIQNNENEHDCIKNQELISLQHQYAMLTFLNSYLENPAKNAELMPAVGIEELGVDKQISFYNQQLLKRNQLAQNADDNMEIIQDLNQSLEVARQNIGKSIDNLIVNLELRMQEITVQEQYAKKRMNSNEQLPDSVNELINQQPMKESLCRYLLQKREANALSMAAIDSSIRHVDDAYGSPEPVAPNVWFVFLFAIMVSIFGMTLLLFFVRLLSRK